MFLFLFYSSESDKRGLANQRGDAKEPVKYFAASDNKDLGIVKQKRKNNRKLILAPFPII
jgi:hypothetical protein